MDTILRGILSSDQKDSIKKQVVTRISRSGSDPKQRGEIEKMFFLCFDTLVSTDDPFSVWACKQVYMGWAHYNSSTLNEIFDRQQLLFFLGKNFRNNQNAIWILHETFFVLQKSQSSNFDMLCQTVEIKAISYVREHPKAETVIPFCKFLKTFNQCIPKGEMTATFCIAIINAVSAFAIPSDQKKVHAFITDVTVEIGRFLKHIWSNTDPECLHQCLRAIFKVISYVDDDRSVQPCVALAGVATHIPVQLIDEVTKMTVEDATISDASMSEALMRMVDWLNWPVPTHVEIWIIAFLKGLASVHKFTILVSVTEAKVSPVSKKFLFC